MYTYVPIPIYLWYYAEGTSAPILVVWPKRAGNPAMPALGGVSPPSSPTERFAPLRRRVDSRSCARV